MSVLEVLGLNFTMLYIAKNMFNLCNRQLTEQNVHSHQQLWALLLYSKLKSLFLFRIIIM